MLFSRGTPVVFTSVNIRALEKFSLKPNTTGIAVKRDIRDTLDVALRLQPDTTQVIVPVGTSPLEKSWTADLQNSLRSYEDHLTITYLGDLSMEDIQGRLRNLPRHTIVLFSKFFFATEPGVIFGGSCPPYLSVVQFAGLWHGRQLSGDWNRRRPLV